MDKTINWSFDCVDAPLGDKTATEENFASEFFENVKSNHEKIVRRSARVAKKVRILEEPKIDEIKEPPAKKPKTEPQKMKQKGPALTEPAKALRPRVTRASRAPVTKAPRAPVTKAPVKPTLPRPAVKSLEKGSGENLTEFFKFKKSSTPKRPLTKVEPFSFMVREEQRQKTKAKEAEKKLAEKDNVYQDGDIEFSKPKIMSTTIAAINRLAQPKSKPRHESVEEIEKPAHRRVLKARRVTQAQSPQFATAKRAKRRVTVSAILSKEAEEFIPSTLRAVTEKPKFQPTVGRSPKFMTATRAKKRALNVKN